ncbi:site-specific integrase [Chitinophaga sancti]|uniref:Site-specific integrase n=2 Tax=Chitinophaga sancti TaxID=1004 RepID=A0ABZ0XRX7_9BACT|nr:site-specific integrase [Chitinophaga sancti]WQD61464.1 site-specific integrase [Chitinophaga sancti]WQG92979.1 site-specific integrase [Chitinophaga sancti]
MNILEVDYKFWMNRSKTNKFAKTPIYFRLYVGKNKTEIATGIFIDFKNWDEKRGRINYKEPDFEILNLKIDELRDKYKAAVKKFDHHKQIITPEILKNEILEKGSIGELNGLIEYYDSHLKKLTSLIGKDYCFKTVERYGITLKYLEEFLHKKLNIKELPIANLSNKIIGDFDLFLKTVKNNNPNTAAKSLTNLKAVINNAISDGVITNNPFKSYKIKLAPTNVAYLTEDELSKIEGKIFSISRLEFVRRIFLFQCYTGLAYSDVSKLKSSELIELNGKLWIDTYRVKTEIPVRVPLIKKALDIVNTFDRDKELLFDVYTNQKMNSYLKEIADLCEITKKLSTHVARHTFATTVTLAKGISITSVSSMLGHTSLKTTAIYAKAVPLTIQKEMANLDL